MYLEIYINNINTHETRVLNKQKIILETKCLKKTFFFIMNEDYLVLKGLKSKVEPRKLSMTRSIRPITHNRDIPLNTGWLIGILVYIGLFPI